MEAAAEHAALVDLIAWIDAHTAGVTIASDDRTLLAAGCFDVALEHQAAVALLHQSELYGSVLALLRVLAESLVRGLWLLHCATDAELQRFKAGRIDKTFKTLVDEFEASIGTPQGVLSGLHKSAWTAFNGFTHTGFAQVSRRHSPGRVEAAYPAHELAQALDVAGALGMVAAGQIIGLSDRPDLLPAFSDKMKDYGARRPSL